jgi:hypothetical protein
MANQTPTNDLPTALRKAAQELARQISEATTLEVVTKWVIAAENGAVDWEAARPVARTRVQLDGDSELIIPMAKEGDSLVIRQDLLAMHESNVQNARGYREKLYDMILDVAREIRAR